MRNISLPPDRALYPGAKTPSVKYIVSLNITFLGSHCLVSGSGVCPTRKRFQFVRLLCVFVFGLSVCLCACVCLRCPDAFPFVCVCGYMCVCVGSLSLGVCVYLFVLVSKCVYLLFISTRVCIYLPLWLRVSFYSIFALNMCVFICLCVYMLTTCVKNIFSPCV